MLYGGDGFGADGPAYVPASPPTPASRTATNRYTGWVDDTDVTKVKLLSGISTYLEFAGSFNVANQTFEGHSYVYFDVNENDATGLWNAAWGSNPFFIDPDGDEADVYFSWNLSVGSEGWSTDSNDDGAVMPEPATVTLLLAGVAGLTARRKRRG